MRNQVKTFADDQTFYIVVCYDADRRCFEAVISNAGRNGNEDNYSYKTIRGAERRMAKELSARPELRCAIFEVDGCAGDQGALSARARRAAKRFMLI